MNMKMKNFFIILILSIFLVGCSTIKKDLANVKECNEDNSYFIKSRECLKQQINSSNISDDDLKDILFLYIDSLNKGINSKLISDENGWKYFNDYYAMALKSKSDDENYEVYVEINNAIQRLK